MTATTLSRLPLLAGSAVAASLGRAGLWTLGRYMGAPLASTGLLALVTLTAMSASNALYWQTTRHPSPFFAPSPDVPVPVAEPKADVPVLPAIRQQTAVVAPAIEETTGSVAPPAPVLPDGPVGNPDAFAVQKKLFELGIFNGTVDGFYGPMTANAIRTFEQRNNMAPTGALTPDVIDAILRSDSAGRAPVAQAAPVQQPVVQEAVAIAPPQPAQVQPESRPAEQLVAQLPTLPASAAAPDAVGNAAAQTIDSVVAAIDGGRTATAQPAQALPMLASAAQPMPAPVQVASLEPMGASQAVSAVQSQPEPVLATAAVQPANNVQLVSTIQKGLASLGFYHGSIDGHPGDATARAIREFENFHSYQVTGQVNPDLVELLRQAGATV